MRDAMEHPEGSLGAPTDRPGPSGLPAGAPARLPARRLVVGLVLALVGRRLTGDDRRVLRAFTDQLAVALESRRLSRAAAPPQPLRSSRSCRPPDFRVDLAAKQVTRDGREVRLTPTEWQLVEVLVRHRGRLISQRQLLQEVWGPNYGEETNYLRVFIAQLRRKLEPDPAHPRYFITEPGIGYRFQLKGGLAGPTNRATGRR